MTALLPWLGACGGGDSEEAVDPGVKALVEPELSVTPVGPPAGDPTRIQLRFVESDPQSYPPAGAVAGWRFGHAVGPMLGEWSFGGDAGLQGWELNDLRLVDEGSTSLSLKPEGPRPFLWRDPALDASEIHVIEVAVSIASGASVDPFAGSARAIVLTWLREGRTERVRTPAPPAGHDVQDGLRRVRFLVGGHPEWRGDIERLQVHFMGMGDQPNDDPIRLQRLAFMGRPTADVATPLPAGEVGKFLVGGVARNGLVGGPGAPIERELEVPEGASLRVAYGVGFAFGASALFRVEAELEGGERRELFAERWSGDGPEGPRWSFARVDLGDLAGRTVRLRLLTEHDETTTPGWGLPVWAHPEIRVPLGADGPARPNVILMSIDTLRADRLSGYGYERRTSPNLDAWAKERGVLFQNVIAAASWTLPTHVSMLTGANAVEHGEQFPPVSTQHVMLAERLRDAGYSTMAVTGGVILGHDFGFMQGFDAYYPSPAPPEQALEDELSTALAWIEGEQGRPFFLFFHTYEVHDPFHARRPYFGALAGDDASDPGGPIWINAPSIDATLARVLAGRSGPTPFRVRSGSTGLRAIETRDREMISDAYDSGIAYMDRMVARMFERLRQLGLEDTTVIALTSDHGEGLGEHGEYRHRTLYDEILRIPLILSGPGVPATGRVIERQVRQVDVTPTLLDLAGLPPQATGAGRSLVPLMEDPEADFEEMAWSYAPTNFEGLSLRVANRQKYIVNDAALESLRGHERFFDLTRDPSEDRAGSEGPVHMREAARELLLANWHGLDVWIRNAERHTLRVSVHGHLATSRMRSASFGEVQVRLEGTPGTITLQPGTQWKGMWLGPDPLTLEGSWEGASPGSQDSFDLTVEPLTVRGLTTLGWWEGAWGPVAEGTSPETVLVIEPQGRSAAGEDGGIIDDPAVLEQLKALGYVR